MTIDFKPDRSRLLDTTGRPITQALFLEVNYDEKYAVYTLKDVDFNYNGTLYPSLKRLFIDMADPTEYAFATKYLLGWQHWKRICDNKMLARHIAEWREELELKLRSIAIRDLQDLCSSENGNFQAAKFLADRGWDKRGAGRPSKAEVEHHAAVDRRIDEEFGKDVARMEDFRKV